MSRNPRLLKCLLASCVVNGALVCAVGGSSFLHPVSESVTELLHPVPLAIYKPRPVVNKPRPKREAATPQPLSSRMAGLAKKGGKTAGNAAAIKATAAKPAATSRKAAGASAKGQRVAKAGGPNPSKAGGSSSGARGQGRQGGSRLAANPEMARKRGEVDAAVRAARAQLTAAQTAQRNAEMKVAAARRAQTDAQQKRASLDSARLAMARANQTVAQTRQGFQTASLRTGSSRDEGQAAELEATFRTIAANTRAEFQTKQSQAKAAEKAAARAQTEAAQALREASRQAMASTAPQKKLLGKLNELAHLSQGKSNPTKAGDTAEGQEIKTESREANDEPEQQRRPQPRKGVARIVLKTIKMWAPKPGQKLSLPTNLDIVLSDQLRVIPGPPLDEEQLAELAQLMARRNLQQVKMNRKQLKALLETRRQSESRKPKPKPRDDSKEVEQGRRREAKREEKEKGEKGPSTPKDPSNKLERPQAPFQVRQWDREMSQRWAMRARDDEGQAGTSDSSPSAAAPLNGARPDARDGETQNPQAATPGNQTRSNGGNSTGIGQNTQGGAAGTGNGKGATGGDSGASQGRGEGVGGGDAQSTGSGNGQGVGAGQGTGSGNGQGVGEGDGSGEGVGGGSGSGSGQGVGAGNGHGQGVGSGSGNGNGQGVGSGSGSGNGQGVGSGSGSGSGQGVGSGSGSGSGSGNGQGVGSGSGSGSGSGNGQGVGSGNGSGEGEGDGQGDGSGTGEGEGEGDGEGGGSGTGTGDGGGSLTGETSENGSDIESELETRNDGTGVDSTLGEQNITSMDLPPDAPIGGHTIPGGLVLPPVPPVGTETGRSPILRPVRPSRFLEPEAARQAVPGRQAVRSVWGQFFATPPRPASPQRRTPPTRVARNTGATVPQQKPQQMTPDPQGQAQRPVKRALPSALTIGSTSSRGTVPFVVVPRAFLPQGSVVDTVDPIQTPANGVAKSKTLDVKRPAVARVAPTVARPRAPRPRLSPALLPAPKPMPKAVKGTSAQKAVPGKVARPGQMTLARNSEGIKEGSEQPLPAAPMPGNLSQIGDGSGLKGEYYLGNAFNEFIFSRADANIDFTFSSILPNHSPNPRIPPLADYTARWTGRIAAQHSETYTFYAAVDDGIRVWIDHKLVLDQWGPHSPIQYSSKFTFEAGRQYLFKCEYLATDGGTSLIHLYWESPSQKKVFVPQDSFFYPLATDEVELAKDKAPLR